MCKFLLQLCRGHPQAASSQPQRLIMKNIFFSPFSLCYTVYHRPPLISCATSSSSSRTRLRRFFVWEITKQITLHLMMSISHLHLMLIFTVAFFLKIQNQGNASVRSLLNDSLDGAVWSATRKRVTFKFCTRRLVKPLIFCSLVCDYHIAIFRPTISFSCCTLRAFMIFNGPVRPPGPVYGN